MSFSNQRFVNFSDGPASGLFNPALLAYLGEHLSDPLISDFATEGYEYILQDESAVAEEWFRSFLNLSRFILRAPKIANRSDTAPRQDVFLKDYGAVITKSLDEADHLWEFAAKAGHNAEHHNHNDCGSFILNIDGHSIISEIGAPEYDDAYFKSDQTRYTFLAARSLGHSVPLVNHCEQAAGADYRADVSECFFDDERVRFVIDLTQTYPEQANCKSLIRTLTLDKHTGELLVEDAFDLHGPGEVESILMLEAPPLQKDTQIYISTGKAEVKIQPLDKTRCKKIDRCTYSDRSGRLQHIYRIHFSLTKPITHGMLSYRISICAFK
ncbi:MAG: heparinase II/III family protein [Chthoniobacterales bacterium]